MRPPTAVMDPYAAESPSPEPSTLVVKNGSNARACTSCVIPQPSSSTAMITTGPGTTSAPSACFVVVTVMWPMPSIASPRVEQQVQQHLTELPTVGRDDALVGRVADVELDPRRERAHDELDHLVDDGPDVEATRDAAFLTAEQEQLADEVGAVVGGLLDAARVLGDAVVGHRLASRSPTRS